MLYFDCITLLPYYLTWYRKTLYVNVTEYNNIDIFTKLIRLYNNLYKHWYIEKSYISYIHIHVHDI